ncbi:MAG: ATP-binding protein [Chloroflexi bacterium]|nr:ATP-binding protein [Chloroflexota bacterium]
MAARAILDRGTDEAVFDERLSPEFARAAVDTISDHFASQGLMRQILRGATQGASQLNVEEFHGLIEIIQNADDVGAREVRIAVRRKADGPELVVAHDGGRVQLRHVVAMSFAFLTTKAMEAASKGRFGIGLKTLARLGSNLEVHCAPYNFVVRGHDPRSVGPAAPIPGFYNPKAGETLFRLSLKGGFDEDEFRSWFTSLTAADLLFLDTVASVRMVDLSARARTVSQHSVSRSPARRVTLIGPRGNLEASVMKIRAPRSRASWTRVTVDFPVPRDVARTGKATGRDSPISIAVGSVAAEGRLFAGLPLRVESHLPFNLNAQFDPDTARVHVQHGKWNTWLLQRAADLIAAAARWQFGVDTGTAWRWVPLSAETRAGSDAWLGERLGEMVESVQRHLAKRLRVPIEGLELPVSKIVYEVGALEGLLTGSDQVQLRPSHAPLSDAQRGRGDRWRRVLEEIGASAVISVTDAVSMFSWDATKLGPRTGEWCVRLAAAGLGAKLDDGLDRSWSVRLASGARTRPPLPTDGYVLVSRPDTTGFAAELELVKVIDDAYLADSAAAADVRRWLERRNRLRAGINVTDALEQLARGGSKPRRLNDAQLVAIRDALSAIDADDRRRLGGGIGEQVLVDGFEWNGTKRQSIEVLPADAYLSATLDGSGRESWATAAGQAPGLKWVHARYKTLLQEPGGRVEADEKGLGARALFTLLGAETAPRLVEPPRPETRYRDVAYPIRGTAGLAQSEAIEALGRYASHLQNDWVSPDLVAVVQDLLRRPVKARRPRSEALLRTLARAWGRLYADRLLARAVFSSWNWQYAGGVPTTWRSIVMGEPWLSNKFGRAKPPRLLALQSPRMLDAFGPNNAWYGAEFEGMEQHAHVLEALGVQTFPHASRIVAALAELRRRATGRALARDAAVLYDALGQHALALTGPITPDRMIDDLSVSQVRAKFGIATSKPGLILAGGRWLPPGRVFRGPPIFGSRRAFVPDRARSDRLWEILNIQPPSITDSIAVLAEIADHDPDAADEAVLLDMYRYLAKRLPHAELKEREGLLRVPLWSGSKWLRKRPIYAVDDPALTLALSPQVPTWASPGSLASLAGLPAALGVYVVNRSAFVPSGIGPRAVLQGRDIQPEFVIAIRHLKARLQRNDPGLYRAIAVGWDALEKARLAISHGLRLEIDLSERAISVSARAHVRPDPLPVLVCLASADEAGSDESTGRAIAALFDPTDADGRTLDRDKVALAWAAAWRQASRGEAVQDLDLPSDSTASDVVLSGMAADLAHGSRRRRVFESLAKQAQVHTRPRPTPGGDETVEPVPVRELKDVADLDVTKWEIVSPPRGKAKTASPQGTITLRAIPTQASRGPSSPASRAAPRGYSPEELETAAAQVLRRVLLTAGRESDDFRAIRRLGADVVDDLKRFFEIKASFGPGGDSVSLTAHEAKRAQTAKPGEFFLAVITGLEKGYQTHVRIIPDPLDTLEWGEDGTLTLTGLRESGIVVEVDLV